VWGTTLGQVEEQRDRGHQEDEDDGRKGAHDGQQLGDDGHVSTVQRATVGRLGAR
jgi:hypothetical protein